MEAASSTPSSAPAGLIPRRGYLLALAVLVGSLLLVVTAWWVAREREVHAAETRFGVRTAEVADRLHRRLVNFELVARGGTALFASMARPTPRQWADYVDGMNLTSRFPSVSGLGFAGYVSNNRLDDLQIEWRDSGYGQLQVRPHGMRAYYGPVLYLEPRTMDNVAQVGLDMLADPPRGTAMRTAQETGTAQLSGPATGVPATMLVLYMPVYRSTDSPKTPAARALSMQGWVFIPFDLAKFVDASLGSSFNDVRFRILDSNGRLLHASHAEDKRTPAFTTHAEMEFYGQPWRIDFESAPKGVAAPGLRALWGMLALGVLTSGLLFGMVWTLARTEDRAHAIALRLTEDYRRSEQRFRRSMHYSAIGKALLDGEGRIVAANPALGRIVGRREDTLVGLSFESLFDNDETSLRPHDNGSTDTDGVHRVTRHLSREGDLPRQAQLTYSRMPGNVGEDVTGLVQVEDVTERVRAQAQVQALNRTLEARVALRTRELSQANHELEAFAYSISHDLRAPLRAIDGFSRILGERYSGQLDESGRDYLARVRKAASRMGELIDAMLKISRLSRVELRTETVDLSRMAIDVLDELRASERAREVAVHIAPGLQAVGDATLLRNLLVNLLGNAWKFTRGRERAVIEFGAVLGAGGNREFYIRDNGAGFAQAYSEKLFRPFQRLHSQEEFSGDGVGLASVKRIIERHGGTIRAEGKEGEGAVFRFTLPGERSSEN
ncbi:CHASE domain-containing protein [Lysobacter fragariae]